MWLSELTSFTRSFGLLIRDRVAVVEIEATVRSLLARASNLDADVARYVAELVDVGEPDLALITLLENAPQVVPSSVVDEMERAFSGSGEYAEREAVNAIDTYRRLTSA